MQEIIFVFKNLVKQFALEKYYIIISSLNVKSFLLRSDIVCRIKYLNQLPDIPFDPKFIRYPFDPNRFVEYNATSLERNYKHELLAEQDLGVTIDLINPETYRIDPNGKKL